MTAADGDGSGSETEIFWIDGKPGAGKTTRLFDYVEEERDRGLGLSDLYFATFARSGREESADRLHEKFPEADREDIWRRAKTFHGVAFTACLLADVFEDSYQQAIRQGRDDDIYETFCDRHGLTYDRAAGNPLRPGHDGSAVEATGNKLFTAYHYLKLLRRGPEYCRLAPVQLSWDRERTVRLMNAWEAFKRGYEELPLYEDADYIDAAIDRELTPDARVLFVDEFQDLSPQEYLLFKTWRESGALDRIYVAGDANQSIYSFRAGRPDYFQEMPVDHRERLDRSHRCPERPARLARWVLESCPETDPRGFEAVNAGGTVAEPILDEDATLTAHVARAVDEHAQDAETGNTVFLLARANYQAKAIAKALRTNGLPFEWLGRHSGMWEDPMPAVLDALRAMRSDAEHAPAYAAKKLLETAIGERERRIGGGTLIPWSKYDLHHDLFETADLWAAFPDADADVRAIPEHLDLDESKRELLDAALGRDDDYDPGQVKIGTIHSAKGLEAPCVYLFDAYTPRLKEDYLDGKNTAEEHRLYYVGATRTSRSLYLVRDYFNGTTVPFLRNGLPDHVLDAERDAGADGEEGGGAEA